MKKLFTKIILISLLSIFLFSGLNFGLNNIYAAYEPIKITPETQWTQENITPGTPADSAHASYLAYVDDVNKQNTALAAEDAKEAAEAAQKGEGWTPAKIGIKLADIALGIWGLNTWYPTTISILTAIGTIFNMVAAIVAGLFNLVFLVSMQSFGTIMTSSGVSTMWVIIRDIINVSFIFILLYTAISIILGSFGPQKKSSIAGVVISALLINFSFFITSIIIDFGNMVAVAIYNKPYSGPGFATLLMEGLQLQTLFSPGWLSMTGQINALFLQIIQIVLVCVFISTLWKGMVLMLGRIVMLIVLLATSPIGFVGLAIPWIKDKSDEWWSALVNQVFLLPIFFFFLMMTNILLKNGTTLIWSFDSLLSLVGPTQTTQFQPGQWIYFCLIIGVLHMGINMTKKMSGKVGDVMDKAAKGLKKAAAYAIAIGASVATSGAAAGPAMALVGRMASSTGTNLLSRAGRAVGGGLQRAAGSTVGQGLISAGRAARNLHEDEGLGGEITRSITKNLLDNVKDHTGLDIAAANKSLADRQKEYTKRAGEQANRIGPADIDAEMKLRRETMENILARAEEKAGDDKVGANLIKGLQDATKINKDLTAQITDLDTQIKEAQSPETKRELFEEQETRKKQLEVSNQDIKQRTQAVDEQKTARAAEIKAFAKEIGDKMGYKIEEHDKKMGSIGADGKPIKGELAIEREKRQAARDTYLTKLSDKGYRGKKAAEILRALKDAKFKDKSSEEILIDQIRKEAKEAAEKEAKNKTT